MRARGRKGGTREVSGRRACSTNYCTVLVKNKENEVRKFLESDRFGATPDLFAGSPTMKSMESMSARAIRAFVDTELAERLAAEEECSA